MPHAYINGFGGSIVFGTGTLAVDLDVDSWSLNITAEAVSTTNTGDAGWDSNILGAMAFEGTAKAYWDSADIPTTSIKAGDRGDITLNVGDSGHDYSGEVQITSVAIENPVKGAVGFSLNFTGSGPLTY